MRTCMFFNNSFVTGIAFLHVLLFLGQEVANAQDKCPGICYDDGEELLNRGNTFKIDDVTATCGYFDSQNMQLDDIGTTCEDDSQRVQDGGCKCGVPVNCTGICAEGEELLNRDSTFEIDDKTATCGYFDGQNQEQIDGEICEANAQAALDAGCKCGVPIECPGICAEGEDLLNSGDLFTICGLTATCGHFNNQNMEQIDGEVCERNAMNARLAGCNCTGEYIDNVIDCGTSEGAGSSGAGSFSTSRASLLIGVGVLMMVAGAL